MEFSLLFTTFVFLSISTTLVQSQGNTRVGFYSTTCPRVSTIVRSTVQSHFLNDPTVAPGLLRMHFHDCFVDGCDGSVLISGPGTERTSGANLGLKGFQVINDAKEQLEAACPGVVSCADILALAARDSVFLTKGTSWNVPTGRRDGRVSLASNTNNLASPSDSVEIQKQKFAAFGLDTQDLVTLVGGHTLGTTGCEFFRHRLYDFTTTGNGADPSIDPALVSQLRAACPRNTAGKERVPLDVGSHGTFDSSYFNNVKNGRGILESDQRLWSDGSTRLVVQSFLGVGGLEQLDFDVEFGRAMVKMGNIGVKTGVNGEIRRVCSSVN